MASLTDGEKTRVRYFLGYPGMTMGAIFQAGVISSFTFAITNALEWAMDHLSDDALPLIRKLLDTLEGIEKTMSESALCRLRIRAAGDVEMNNKELIELGKQLYNWKCKLADFLGVKIYDNSYQSGLQPGQSGSIPRNPR